MEYTKVLYFLMLCIIILTVLVLYLFFPLLSLSSPYEKFPTSFRYNGH